MINDLPKRITFPAVLYADDFCFWECGSNIALLNQLCQRSLTKVCDRCVKCGFKLSTTKSAAVLFTKERNPASISLLLQGGAHLQLKNEYKYLVITFQRNGSYSTHIQKVAPKCPARLNYPLYAALLSHLRWIGNPINHSSTTVSVSPSCLSAHVFNYTRFSESN